MLGLPQYLREPHWSTALCARERTQRRHQATGWRFSTHPTLPDDRSRIWLGQNIRHWKRDHITYARFYRGTEHCLHMCQLTRNTRSRLQSSTRLLVTTKARASLNQLNNFNASAESHTRQQQQPPSPLSPMFMFTWPQPNLPYLHYLTFLPSYLYTRFPCFYCFDKPRLQYWYRLISLPVQLYTQLPSTSPRRLRCYIFGKRIWDSTTAFSTICISSPSSLDLAKQLYSLSLLPRICLKN